MGLNNNKPPWTRNKVDGQLTPPDIYALVDLHFVTLFIAERLEIEYDDIYAQKDAIRHQISYAVKKGDLATHDGKFRFGEFTAWVQTKSKLAIAAKGLLSIGHATGLMTMPSMRFSASGVSLPTTLTACHEALTHAYRELNKLREDVLALRGSIDALTPYKEKADLLAHKGRISGRKVGKQKTGGTPKKP